MAAMSGAICNGILSTRRKFVKCPRCKRNRLHDVHERYDSVLFVCRKCKLTRICE